MTRRFVVPLLASGRAPRSIGEEGAGALARSPYLGRLRELTLHRNAIAAEGAGRALRQRYGDRVRLS